MSATRTPGAAHGGDARRRRLGARHLEEGPERRLGRPHRRRSSSASRASPPPTRSRPPSGRPCPRSACRCPRSSSSGFIPMLLVAFGYRELNRRMPDSGTSFTWATRAFGPWVGWLAGWGLDRGHDPGAVEPRRHRGRLPLPADLADLGQPRDRRPGDRTRSSTSAVCLLFMLGATWVSYRDMQTTQKLQYWLVGFQVLVLVLFSVAALVAGRATATRSTPRPIELSWFNPFAVESFSRRSRRASRSRSSSSGAGTSPSR